MRFLKFETSIQNPEPTLIPDSTSGWVERTGWVHRAWWDGTVNRCGLAALAWQRIEVG